MDPRLVAQPGFVIKTWEMDRESRKVFVNVCTVNLKHVLNVTSSLDSERARAGSENMYGSVEEAMNAVKDSQMWCVLSKKVFHDTDKLGVGCRVIHCGVDGMTMDASRSDKRFKMILVASILSKILVECRLHVEQDLERIKLPRMKSKGIIPAVASWGVPLFGEVEEHHNDNSYIRTKDISTHDSGNEKPVIVEGRTKRLDGKKQNEIPRQYSLEYNGVPVHSVSILIRDLSTKQDDPRDLSSLRAYTKGSKVYVQNHVMTHPLVIETNLMLNGKECARAMYALDQGILSIEVPVISFGRYLESCSSS